MMCAPSRLLPALLLASLLPLFSLVAAPEAVTPQPRDPAPDWWYPRHEEKVKEAKERGDSVQVVFIGDSITHYWNEEIWNDRVGRFEPLNLGFSGDETQHVLWRLQNGELDGLSPELVTIMIGTNNTGNGQDPAQDTIEGIAAIVDEVKTRLPESRILLLSIFPRGADSEDRYRKVNAEINEALPELAKSKGIDHLSINDAFLDSEGKLPRNVMPDLLHPNKHGNWLWAEALVPVLEEYLDTEMTADTSKTVPLWPEGVPAPGVKSPEETSEDDGRVLRITNVGEPSLQVYLPKSRRPTPVVLVCPGGGYNILAWDKEGTEIAEWLNEMDYAAAVLKYRVPDQREGALQDAQRAMRLLRSNAADWNLDDGRMGVMGFSAGANLSARLSAKHGEKIYDPVDAADELSARPDFVALIYPAYLANDALQLTDKSLVDANTPPTFVIQAQDDSKYIASAIGYYVALHQAGVPSELHIFPSGGHGFGMRPSIHPVSKWGDLYRDWLLQLP